MDLATSIFASVIATLSITVVHLLTTRRAQHVEYEERNQALTAKVAELAELLTSTQNRTANILAEHFALHPDEEPQIMTTGKYVLTDDWGGISSRIVEVVSLDMYGDGIFYDEGKEYVLGKASLADGAATRLERFNI